VSGEQKSAIRYPEGCRLCRASDIRCVVELASVPVLTVNTGQTCPPHTEMAPLNLCQCVKCGHLQLANYIDPELQYRNFNYRTASSLGLVQHFEELAENVWWRINDGFNTFVVDVGSNDGILLQAFQKKGAQVLGIEPGFTIAQEAQLAGVPTIPQFFNAELAEFIVRQGSISRQGGQADVVTCCNTMANLSDLAGFIEGIKILLKPDGLFVFETQYGADVINKLLIDTIYHEHQSYFLVDSLKQFFSWHELELVQVDLIPTKGGSIRGFVQRRGCARQYIGDSVAGIIRKERTYRLDAQHTYDEFSRRLDEMRSQLERALLDVDGEILTAVGFGVSVGSSTLIAQLDLEDALEYLVDDNPQIGELPAEYGSLPVYHSDFLYDDRPDLVVILAWRYAEQIIEKHQRFIDDGGQFIVPWPEFRIVGKASVIN
jgi:SAM-dependent methyltransferase